MPPLSCRPLGRRYSAARCAIGSDDGRQAVALGRRYSAARGLAIGIRRETEAGGSAPRRGYSVIRGDEPHDRQPRQHEKSVDEQARSGRDETEKERLDRNMTELVGELRVALPGVQVLFAFLLTVPFNQRFSQVTSFDETIYLVTLLSTAVATALLLAPSALHRIEFRQDDKEHIVKAANRYAIAGFAALMVVGHRRGAAGHALPLRATRPRTCRPIAVGVLLACCWYVMPTVRRARHGATRGLTRQAQPEPLRDADTCDDLAARAAHEVHDDSRCARRCRRGRRGPSRTILARAALRSTSRSAAADAQPGRASSAPATSCWTPTTRSDVGARAPRACAA